METERNVYTSFLYEFNSLVWCLEDKTSQGQASLTRFLCLCEYVTHNLIKCAMKFKSVHFSLPEMRTFFTKFFLISKD
jgi:hypothetical protein